MTTKVDLTVVFCTLYGTSPTVAQSKLAAAGSIVPTLSHRTRKDGAASSVALQAWASPPTGVGRNGY
jgi:hypothetical protein